MPGVTLKFDRRDFDWTLARYRQFSKRDPATIVNTKAFYISRRAAVETVKTPAGVIRNYLNQQDGRVAGMIINSRRGKAGQPGLYGNEMRFAVAMMKAARIRSRAFLASGWIPAIKKLAPLAEHPGRAQGPRGSKQFGQAKGAAKPATGGLVCKCLIENNAGTRWDRGGHDKHGLSALKRAFDFEVRSMKAYIERKTFESAKKAGIKVIGG